MPGVARQSTVRVGNHVRVTFLPDGFGLLEPDTFMPAPPGLDWSNHRQYLDADGMVFASMGGFLVETYGVKVLVDLGLGSLRIEPGEVPGLGAFEGGPFLQSLRGAGYGPEDIDKVVFTHLHFDHIGWTSRRLAGPRGTRWALTFRNADHVCPRREWDYWYGTDAWVGPRPEEHQALLADRIELAEDGETVAPGVTFLATPGHTPGHSAVVISDGAERLLVLGDAVFCPVQLTEAEWGGMTEVDKELAAKSRALVIQQLESPDTTGACAHFADFAFGRLVRGQGKRYWMPLQEATSAAPARPSTSSR